MLPLLVRWRWELRRFGALAIGALSIRRLRLMEAALDDVHIRRLRVGKLEIESMRTPEKMQEG
ncbi:MAG TPA: hypothetical protein VNY78_09800 [Edaphobacter sp.]|nr:hypothetical protein [Edaphobacter sp.]